MRTLIGEANKPLSLLDRGIAWFPLGGMVGGLGAFAAPDRWHWVWLSVGAYIDDYRSDRLSKNLVAQLVDDALQRIGAKPFPKICVLIQTAALSRKSDGSLGHKAFVPMLPSQLLSNQVGYYKRHTK